MIMEIYYVLQLLYLMLPAYFANMAPVFVCKILKPLAYPLDFGYKWKGKRILGTHKTMRGLIAGIIAAIIIVYMQQMLYRIPFFTQLSLINYDLIGPMLGFLMGFGALFGDAVGSFIKRQCNIKEGKKFLPIDQIDFVIGALYFMAFIYHPGWSAMGIIIIATFVLALIVKRIGYYLGLGQEKW